MQLIQQLQNGCTVLLWQNEISCVFTKVQTVTAIMEQRNKEQVIQGYVCPSEATTTKKESFVTQMSVQCEQNQIRVFKRFHAND